MKVDKIQSHMNLINKPKNKSCRNQWYESSKFDL